MHKSMQVAILMQAASGDPQADAIRDAIRNLKGGEVTAHVLDHLGADESAEVLVVPEERLEPEDVAEYVGAANHIVVRHSQAWDGYQRWAAVQLAAATSGKTVSFAQRTLAPEETAKHILLRLGVAA